MNTAEWFKTHKQEAALGAGGIVVAVVLAIRNKKKQAASTSSTTSTTANQAYAYPADPYAAGGADPYSAGGVDPYSGYGYAGFSGGYGQAPAPASPAPSSPASGASGASAKQGFGTVTADGQTFDELGQFSPSTYWGYQVGGGAPVYYLPPGASAPETNLNQQAVAALPTGTELLTPTFWGGQIGASPGVSQRTGVAA